MADEGKTTVVDRPSSAPEPKKRATERYTQGDEIGRGGMGRVVEATDTLLDRRVAVKEALTTDTELLRRFARETKITARLEHPSIVPLYDAGTSDGAPYYVMRRVTGRPLSELIKNAPTLNERLALVPHVLAAAQAIAHAHQRGIIHRDIKPSNILVGELGETVVIDWGLAKVIGETDEDREAPEPGAGMSLRTRMGAVFGTPGFMAPDQLRGDAVGPEGDVYSLGASLYNLLAAEPPHYASESTQMMNLAAKGPPRPIAEVVPGAPRELVTIVDTAIDYDTSRRYKDAGAFAEDLKRFLAGQLVASHRYSAGEKLVRFVRKHRAAVAIGMAGLVVVIVVGALAFSRVIAERDRADEQAQLASQGQQAAEASRAMAAERADQLLLSRARALVDTNPTAAVASLKQLSPTSKLVDEASAIAKAARMRGVGWAIKAEHGTTSTIALDHGAQRLAQVLAEGKLHVYDFRTRGRVFSLDVPRGTHPDWLLESKVLMISGAGPTRLVDGAGKALPTTLPPMTATTVDDPGATLCAIDTEHRALRIDAADQRVRILMPAAIHVAVSPDGTFCAVETAKELVLFDRDAKVRWRRAHVSEFSRLAIGATKIAYLERERIWQASLADGRFYDLPMYGDPRYWPIWLDYQRDRLLVAMTDSRLLVNPSDRIMAELARVDYGIGPFQSFGDNYLTLGGDGRTIVAFDGTRVRQVHLPITLRMIRVIGRRGQPRLVAVGDDAIIVVELDLLPQPLFVEPRHQTRFVTDNVLMSSSESDFMFAWFDLDKRMKTDIVTSGFVSLERIEGKRVAVIDRGAKAVQALVYEVGNPAPVDHVDAPFDEMQLVTGDRIVYSVGHTLFGGKAGAHRELFRTDGDVQILARMPDGGFAAITPSEIVRGDLDDNTVKRVPLTAGVPVNYVVPYKNDVVLARGKQVLRWGEKLTLFAELPSDVTILVGTPHGVLVELADGTTLMIADDGKQTRLASTRGPVVGGARRIVVPGPLKYDVVEMPSLARWSLPIVPHTNLTDLEIDMSPDGNHMIEKTVDGRVWLWNLPGDQDLASELAWTNFTEDESGILLWPWQSANLK